MFSLFGLIQHSSSQINKESSIGRITKLRQLKGTSTNTQ